MQQLIRNQNKKREEKIKELQDFIQPFLAPTSPRASQATSRKKVLDSIAAGADARLQPQVPLRGL